MSCILIPEVTNKEGQKVESKLWMDLLQLSSKDREFTKKMYYIGTHPDFINTYRNQLDFDENGEVTLESLNRVLDLNVSEEEILNKLNKEVGNNIRDYDTAVDVANSFNQNSPNNKEYMATITPEEGGNTRVEVVRNNDLNRQNYEDNLASKILFDRIKAMVQHYGGDITFIDERYSKYDTTNAEKASNGLFGVIHLSKDGNHLDDISEETGHFAIGLLGNHSLAQRLIAAVSNEEVQKSLFKDGINRIQTADNPAREAAGELVGRYIRNEIDTKTPLYNLVSRVWDTVKKMFYNVTANELKKEQLNAKLLAKKIAREFLQGSDKFNIENALGYKEILFSKEPSLNVRTLFRIITHLKTLAVQTKDLNQQAFRDFMKLTKDTVAKKHLHENYIWTDLLAIEGIVGAINAIADEAPRMLDLMDSIDIEDLTMAVQNAKKIREARVFVDNTMNILRAIEDFIASEDSATIDPDSLQMIKNAANQLNVLLRGANDVNHRGLLADVRSKERKLFTAFMQDIYGEEYIHRAERVLFKGFKLHKVEAEDVPISRLIEELQEDDNWFDRWLSSAANSSDIIVQLAYKARTIAANRADTLTAKAWNNIESLHQEFKELAKKLKISESELTERFLERSNNTGRMTGNYLSDRNHGDWENNFEEFKRDKKKEWRNSHPEYSGLPKLEQDYYWQEYFDPLYKEWHKQNSHWDEESERYVPVTRYDSEYEERNLSVDYYNDQYDSLSIDEKGLLNKIISEKEKSDDLLCYTAQDGSVVISTKTYKYRMPQFRGSTLNRTTNLRNSLKMSIPKAFMTSLRKTLIELFVESSEDRDYGDMTTFNEEDDGFITGIEFENAKVNRIQIYGINKLKNPEDLKTDLFAGLAQYAAMANTYSALTSTIDFMELGRNALLNRIVKKDSEGLFLTEAELQKVSLKGKYTKSYSRYLNFLEAQYYNIYAPKIKLGPIVVDKVFKLIQSIGSVLFLGGNIHGGLVNVGTGFIEITKEAIAGEFFSASDYANALKIYGKYAFSNILESGKDLKQNKLFLFNHMFNIQNNFDEKIQSYNTRKHRLAKVNPFGDYIFAPYSSGDHFMQNMSYLSVAQKYKFKNPNTGEEYNLWDAFDPVDNNGIYSLKLKEGLLFVDPKTGSLREWKDGNNPANDNSDVVAFQNLCREVNNRMHGIYNKLDKTSFHTNIYGGLWLAMKGYALGLIQRRFSVNKHNISLDTDTEGSIITAHKVVFEGLFNNRRNFKRALRALIFPFFEGSARAMKEMGFSESQYRNMRRNWLDGFFICILVLLKLLSVKSKGEDDDDDEDNKAMGYLHYFSHRLLIEQTAFNWIPQMYEETMSLGKAVPSGGSALWQLGNLSWLFLTQEQYEKAGATYEEDDYKWWVKARGYIPYYRTFKPDGLIDNPYKAVESFDYGRSLNK